jgi:hypothetical protein
VFTACFSSYLLMPRRKVLVSSVPVLQALYNMVKCTSSRTRIRIGTAVCNLLSCPETNRAAINAGALSVVKIIATMDFEELREATARVIINLAQDESLQDLMLRQPIVEILVLILQQSTNYTFECAIMACSCLSQTKLFKAFLISRGGITALMGTIITGKVCTPLVAEEVCRCLCHLSYNYENAESMVRNGHLILSMQAIYLSGLCSADTALLITLTMRNLSEAVAARRYIIDQGAFKLLVSIITDFTFNRYCCTIMYSAMVTFVYNLSTVPALHVYLVQQGLMNLLAKICLYGEAQDFALPGLLGGGLGHNKLATMSEDINENDQEDDNLSQNLSIASEENFRVALSRFGSADSEAYNTRTGSSKFPTHGEKVVVEDGETATSASVAAGKSGKSMSSNGTGTEAAGGAHQSGSFMPTEQRSSLLYHKDHRKSIIKLASDGGFGMLLNFTHNEVNYISKMLNMLSQSHGCPQAMVEGGVMRIFKALIEGLSEGARSDMASALSNLAAVKCCRESLVQQGAGELLIALSITSDPNTQAQCALALGYLSELTKVSDGVVASLLLLSLNLEEATANSQSSGGGAGGVLGGGGLLDGVGGTMVNSRRGGGTGTVTPAIGGGGGGGGGAGGGGAAAGAVGAVTPTAAAAAAASLNEHAAKTAAAAAAAGAAGTAVGAGGNEPNIDPVTGAIIPTTKTLTALLRDVIVDKTKFDSYFQALKSNNDNNLSHNDFVPSIMRADEATTSDSLTTTTSAAAAAGDLKLKAASKLHVNEMHREAILAEETAMLRCDFQLYRLETSQTSDTYESESGGMSVNALMELPLPGIPANRDLEPLNRHDELYKEKSVQEPLPKNTHPPFQVDSRTQVGGEGGRHDSLEDGGGGGGGFSGTNTGTGTAASSRPNSSSKKSPKRSGSSNSRNRGGLDSESDGHFDDDSENDDLFDKNMFEKGSSNKFNNTTSRTVKLTVPVSSKKQQISSKRPFKGVVDSDINTGNVSGTSSPILSPITTHGHKSGGGGGGGGNSSGGETPKARGGKTRRSASSNA